MHGFSVFNYFCFNIDKVNYSNSQYLINACFSVVTFAFFWNIYSQLGQLQPLRTCSIKDNSNSSNDCPVALEFPVKLTPLPVTLLL